MKRLSIITVAALMCMLFAGSAMAFDWPDWGDKGDLFGGNELNVYQDGALNHADIKQEDCFGCDNPFEFKGDPVAQNKAKIDQYGVGNKVKLEQSNTYNRAYIHQKGAGNYVKATQK